jgi:uncharacterized protein involved in exopolysaccharide biosynthesis
VRTSPLAGTDGADAALSWPHAPDRTTSGPNGERKDDPPNRMIEYRTVARRHRLLLLIPIVIAPLLALWVVLGTPNEYQSTASLWFDTPPPADSSVTNPDALSTPPAAQTQILLNEMLQTKQFRSQVGDRSGLTGYVTNSAPKAWDPMSLLKGLRGKQTTDTLLRTALGPAHVTSSVDGPQVLTLSVEQPAPGIAQATLQALIDQFRQERNTLDAARAASAASYYQDQVSAAKQADDALKKQVASYLQAHPSANTTDPGLAVLSQAEQAASAKLLDAQNNLNVANIGVTAPGTDEASMRVIDPPAAPHGPVRGIKALAMAGVGGLFGGIVIAAAGLFGLVSLGRMRARGVFDAEGGDDEGGSDAELVRLLRKATDVPAEQSRDGGQDVAAEHA